MTSELIDLLLNAGAIFQIQYDGEFVYVWAHRPGDYLLNCSGTLEEVTARVRWWAK